MAKRKRLDPTRLLQPEAAAPEPRTRAPIADVAGQAAQTAAIEELAGTLTAARAEGRLIQSLPLGDIDAGYLVRDRMDVDAEDLEALKDSLRTRGQQTAIEVADLGPRPEGRWGLISGWRRLRALKEIGAETVLAIVRAPEDAAEAYHAMVEENEIRVGLSYYERARIVVRATDMGVFRVDRVALARLFAAAPASRRSKIGSFTRIVRALDAHLRFPRALNEKRGLALAQALDRDPGLAARVAEELDRFDADEAAEEGQLIDALLAEAAPDAAPETAPEPPERPRKAPKGAAAAPEIKKLSGGLSAALHPDGRIMLRGDRLADPAFREALFRFLEAGDG